MSFKPKKHILSKNGRNTPRRRAERHTEKPDNPETPKFKNNDAHITNTAQKEVSVTGAAVAERVSVGACAVLGYDATCGPTQLSHQRVSPTRSHGVCPDQWAAGPSPPA